MDQYRCKLCDNVVTYGENHPCFLHKKFDYKYLRQFTAKRDKKQEEVKGNSTENSNSRCLSESVQQNVSKKSELVNVPVFQDQFIPTSENRRTTSAGSSNDAQIRNSCDISYLNPISNVQVNEVQSKEDASFTISSENFESRYRSENVQRKAYEEKTIAAGSSGVEMQKQATPGVPDLMLATTDEEGKISLENSKWQSLNKDKNIFMDSLEGVTRNDDHSNISENVTLILDPDVPPRSNQPKKGERKVSESVKDKNSSLEVQSQDHSNIKKMFTKVKDSISTKEDDNAVAGPSGLCSGKKQFPELCSKKVVLKSNYRTPTSDKRFVCDICNKQFSRKSHLDVHYRIHTGETPYLCDKCGKSFKHQSNLMRHYRTHTGDKPFTCDACNKQFSQKSHCDEHYKTHSGERPYVCDICGKPFIQQSNLMRHYRTHTGDKPFKCDVCNKQFSRKSHRDEHYKTHSDICNKGFAQRSDLNPYLG